MLNWSSLARLFEFLYYFAATFYYIVDIALTYYDVAILQFQTWGPKIWQLAVDFQKYKSVLGLFVWQTA